MQTTPFPLTPSTGTIREEQIIGREKEILNILQSLSVQSITIEEMRRMGKTLLLKKLVYLCNNNEIPEELKKENFKAIYFSLQGRKDLGEVIDTLIHGFNVFKKWYQIDLSKTSEFLNKLLGSVKVNVYGAEFSVNLPEYKQSWKKIFFQTLENVSDNLQKDNCKLILILDELPIMLWEWYQAGRHDEVTEFLDILRERRQELESKGLRFVYCGSIGIKVILQTLRNNLSYTGEPTNDMYEFNLNPFSKEDSVFLMECYLLSGYTVDPGKKKKLFETVHELCNGLPYYIANLFLIIQSEFNKEINDTSISGSYDLILNNSTYQKAFNQLKERLVIYYRETSKLMTDLLSILSRNAAGIAESQIIPQINGDEEKTKEALEVLVSDHYLTKTMTSDGRVYNFKYKIFKEWWRINKA
ncbi:hypothetical protein [Chryseobacterium sp. OV279]|uniref:hypothetical protein n=1 Tax=Chryseobacterium sp. OV279 TaxID=1500285 RepID=UPI000648CD47|nr:hypothetical protein [Chryseobacterium sp. OV279]SHF45543.1 hypothetical protein SAMN02787100_2045 [Chryseobacterium sp. OV279]